MKAQFDIGHDELRENFACRTAALNRNAQLENFECSVINRGIRIRCSVYAAMVYACDSTVSFRCSDLGVGKTVMSVIGGQWCLDANHGEMSHTSSK